MWKLPIFAQINIPTPTLIPTSEATNPFVMPEVNDIARDMSMNAVNFAQGPAKDIIQAMQIFVLIVLVLGGLFMIVKSLEDL